MTVAASIRRADRHCRAGRLLAALGLALSLGFPAHAGEVFVGQWGGLVPASLEILTDKTLEICQEDLALQCQSLVPYTRQGDVIVVERLTSGRKWTYTPRADGAFDAVLYRWSGEDGYQRLVEAVLRKR